MTQAYHAQIDAPEHYIGARAYLDEMIRSWRLLALLIALSAMAAVAIVRMSPPMYAASMSMTKADEPKVSALSILGQAAGAAGAPDSSADELRATATSRMLASRLLRDERLAREVRAWLGPKVPTMTERFRRSVATTVFGQKRDYQPSLAERLRTFLDSSLTVENDKGLLEARLKSYDRAFSAQLLRAVIFEARLIMRQRQQTRAIAAREFLSRMMSERSTQLSTQVVNEQMSRAIGDTILALSPSSDKFVVIDDVYSDDRPVSPKIGLITAACLAIGFVLFFGIVAIRVYVTSQHA